MVTLQQIIDYVTTTPENINTNVLSSLLRNSDIADENLPSGVEKKFFYEIQTEEKGDQLYLTDNTIDELKHYIDLGIILTYNFNTVEAKDDPTYPLQGEGFFVSESKNKKSTITIRTDGLITLTEEELEPVQVEE